MEKHETHTFDVVMYICLPLACKWIRKQRIPFRISTAMAQTQHYFIISCHFRLHSLSTNRSKSRQTIQMYEALIELKLALSVPPPCVWVASVLRSFGLFAVYKWTLCVSICQLLHLRCTTMRWYAAICISFFSKFAPRYAWNSHWRSSPQVYWIQSTVVVFGSLKSL